MGAFGGLDAPDAGEEDGGELTEEQKAIVALSARVDALSDEAVRAEAAKRGIETEDYDGTPLEIAEIRQNLAELLASSKNAAGELADVAPAPAAEGAAEAQAAAAAPAAEETRRTETPRQDADATGAAGEAQAGAEAPQAALAAGQQLAQEKRAEAEQTPPEPSEDEAGSYRAGGNTDAAQAEFERQAEEAAAAVENAPLDAAGGDEAAAASNASELEDIASGKIDDTGRRTDEPAPAAPEAQERTTEAPEAPPAQPESVPPAPEAGQQTPETRAEANVAAFEERLKTAEHPAIEDIERFVALAETAEGDEGDLYRKSFNFNKAVGELAGHPDDPRARTLLERIAQVAGTRPQRIYAKRTLRDRFGVPADSDLQRAERAEAREREAIARSEEKSRRQQLLARIEAVFPKEHRPKGISRMSAAELAAWLERPADAQGNPLNADGSLKLEPVASIDELSDGDFTAPTRNVQLPKIPANVDAAIGANGSPVVIKRNIFKRNAERHNDLTPTESRDILNAALYSPDLYGRNQKRTRPFNWVVIITKDANGHNRLVLLEVDRNRDNVQIVHWHIIDQRGLEKIKRWAAREDGQLLMLPSAEAEEAGALSGPTRGLPADGASQGPTPATIAAGDGEVKGQAAPAVRVVRIAGKAARVPTGEGGYGAWSDDLVRAEAEMRGLKGVDGNTPIDEVRRKLEAQDKRAEQGRKNLAKVKNRTFEDPFLNAVFPDGKSVIRVPSRRARELARKDANAPQVGGEWDGFDPARFPGLGDKFKFVHSGWTDIDARMQEAFEAYFGLGMEDSAASGRDRTPDAFWDLLEQAAKTERKVKAHYAEQATEGRQAERFAQDALTERGGSETIQAQELGIGDKVMVRGQELTVTDMEDGTITLSDGSRYGEQSVEDGKTLHVEAVSTRAENAAAAAEGVPDKVALNGMKREDLFAQMEKEGLELPDAERRARMAKPLLVAEILKQRAERGIAQPKAEEGGAEGETPFQKRGKNGGETPELALESATPAQVAAEEKRRREREEIQRRMDAPLDGGKPLEIGQTLMDLGGAEGGGDLFNRVARREEPVEGRRTEPPRQAPKKPFPSSMVLATRSGDFYEFFGDDARRVASALGLTLSTRTGRIFTGVPYHLAESYFGKLDDAGIMVAVANADGEAKPVVWKREEDRTRQGGDADGGLEARIRRAAQIIADDVGRKFKLNDKKNGRPHRFNIAETAEGQMERATRIANAIERKDADALREMLASINTGSIKAFEALAGMKLPKSAHARSAAIDRFCGVTEEERTRREAERKAQAYERAEEERKAALVREGEAILKRTRYLYNGRVMTLDEIVREKLAAGWVVEREKRGATMQTIIRDPANDTYSKMPGKTYEYLLDLQERVKAERAVATQQSVKEQPETAEELTENAPPAQKTDKRDEPADTEREERDAIVPQGMQNDLGTIKLDVAEHFRENAPDGVEIVGIDFHGSRLRGEAREDSDLDAVVEYRGDASEDSLFNMLNDEPLVVDGVQVDINPIRADKTGTLEAFMERSREYDRRQARQREAGEGGVKFQQNGKKPTEAEIAEAKRQYDEVVARYTNPDGTKKKGWMMAPNGKPTRLKERQWVHVNTPNFKANYFGFYNLPEHQFNVVVAETAPFNNANDAIAWAKENGIVGLMKTGETNGKGEINISVASVREMLNPKQREKSVGNEAHYAVLTKLREIIRESELADRHPDYKKGTDGKRDARNGVNPNVTIDVIYGAVRIGTETYRVRTTLKRHTQVDQPTKAYAYEVSEIEVLPGTLVKPETGLDPRGSTSISGNNLLRGVRNHKGNLVLEDFSKVVDENGEPLVVHHGTPHGGHTVFDGKRHDSMSASVDGATFFSSSHDVARSYSNEMTTSGYANVDGQRLAKAKKWLANRNVEVRNVAPSQYEVYVDGEYIADSDADTEKRAKEKAMLSIARQMEESPSSMVYEVFLNMRNPLVVDMGGGLWKGERAPDGYYDNSVPQIAEKAKASGKHDGVVVRNVKDAASILGEGVADDYAVFAPSQIKSATDNVGTYSEHPNILFQKRGAAGERFQCRKPVERRKDLVAFHNVSAKGLAGMDSLGGLAMPSFSVTKDTIGGNEFGEISLLVHPRTIDPKKSRNNAVYTNDAWTPTFPRTKLKMDEKVVGRISGKVWRLLRAPENKAWESLARSWTADIDSENIDDAVNRADGDALAALRDRNTFQIAFLLDTGKAPALQNVDAPLFRTEFGPLTWLSDNASFLQVAERFSDRLLPGGEPLSWDEADALAKDGAFQRALAAAIDGTPRRREYLAEHPEKAGKMPDASVSALRDASEAIASYRKRGIRQEVDLVAASKAVEDAIAANWEEYEAWLGKLTDGITDGKRYVRNNREFYTREGNRRPFSQLYDELTLENAVKAMRGQDRSGAGIFGRNPFGVAARKYGSLKDVIADEGRLQPKDKAKYEARRNELSNRFSDLASKLEATYTGGERNRFIVHGNAVDAFLEEWLLAGGDKRAVLEGIKKYYGFHPTAEMVDELAEIMHDMSSMPEDYFEGKAYRAVRFDEIVAAVVPDNASEKTREILERRGVKAYTYKAKDAADRLRALNEAADEGKLKFQKRGPAALDWSAATPREMRQELAARGLSPAGDKEHLRMRLEGDDRRRSEAREAFGGVQKRAGTEYPDAGEEIGGVKFQLGGKRRAEYGRLLSKHRPDLDAKQVLSELDKYGNPKKEKAALHWVIRGTIRLPEDEYKVDEALEVAAKAHVDPFQYRSPMELLEAHTEFKPTAKAIDPDTVPELSDRRDEGGGIVTYEVEDTRGGQAAMRRIIDTHWGEDANPWCLLARSKARDARTPAFEAWLREERGIVDLDNLGFSRERDLAGWYEATRDGKAYEPAKEPDEKRLDLAWSYWNHYNALPKRVAFKDGKLLAFMATEGLNAENDPTELEAQDRWPGLYREYAAWYETEEGREEQANFFEWMENNHPAELADGITPEQWWDRQDESHPDLDWARGTDAGGEMLWQKGGGAGGADQMLLGLDEPAVDAYAKRKKLGAERKAQLEERLRKARRFAEKTRAAWERAFHAEATADDWRKAFDASEARRDGPPTVSRVLRELYERKDEFGTGVKGLELRTSEDVAGMMMALRSPFQEMFKVVWVDGKRRVLDAQVVHIGSVSASVVHPTNVLGDRPEGATGFFISHNHPSGDPSPSVEDAGVTRRFGDAAGLLGLEMLDHVVTDGENYYSFKSGGMATLPEGKRNRAEWELGTPVNVRSADDVSRIVSMVRQGAKVPVILALGHKNDIRSVRILPGDFFARAFGDPASVRAVFGHAQETGSSRIILCLPEGTVPARNAGRFLRPIVDAGKVFGIPVLDVVEDEAFEGFHSHATIHPALFAAEPGAEAWQGKAGRNLPAVPWPGDFPKIVIHTSRDAIEKQHKADFDAAKAGDADAAMRLVRAVAKPDRIRALAARHPGAIVVPVHAEEATGRNKIPMVYASLYADAGLELATDIVQTVRAERTGKDAWYRMTHRPEFDGPVQAGREYVLVDDHVTQGGTFAALRQYIESHGGKVVEMAGLTASQFSTTIALKSSTLALLRSKFGTGIENELQSANIAESFAALTESEGRYLLKLSPDTLRDRIAEARREEHGGVLQGQVQRPAGEVNGGTVREDESSSGGAEGGVRWQRGGGAAARDWGKVQVPGLREELRRRRLEIPGSPAAMRARLEADDRQRAAADDAGVKFQKRGLYTGSAADYADRREDGTVENGPSLVHIGSGEGSQVYGWGLYASDVRGVADGYAQTAKKLNSTLKVDGLRTDPYSSTEWYSDIRGRINRIGSVDEVHRLIKEHQLIFSTDKAFSPKDWDRLLHTFEKHNWNLEAGEAIVYEQTFFTNRATPEETERHLLKWYDFMPEEQLTWVRDQLGKENLPAGMVYEAIRKAENEWELRRLIRTGEATRNDGAPWYNEPVTGEQMYELLVRETGTPKAASEFLARAGIDGVKYPVDSFGGKTVKDGNKAGWNYVSFRDDNIEVDHKWRDGTLLFQRRTEDEDAPAPFGVDEARQRPRARGTTLAEWREAVVVEEPATLKGSGKNAGKEVPNKDAGKFRIVLPAAEGRRGAVLAGGYESAAAAASELLMYQAGFAETEKALARLPKAKLQEVLRARERAARMLSDLSATKGQHYAHALRAMKALGIPEKFQVKAARRLQAMVEADGANRTELSELRVMKYIDGTLSREAAKAEYRELLKTLNERLPPGRKGETGEIYRARNVAMPELQKIPGMLAMDAGEVARRLARMEAELGAYENFKSGLSENESGLDEDSFRNLQWEQYLLRSFGGLEHDPNLLRVIAAREALQAVVDKGRKAFLAEEEARQHDADMAAGRTLEQLQAGERVPKNDAEMKGRSGFGKSIRRVLNSMVFSIEAGRTLAERMDRRRNVDPDSGEVVGLVDALSRCGDEEARLNDEDQTAIIGGGIYDAVTDDYQPPAARILRGIGVSRKTAGWDE